MKNKYEIRGDITIIHLKRRTGQDLETRIFTSDLDKVNSFSGTWYVQWSARAKSFYVYGQIWNGKGVKRTNIALHSFIMDCPKGYIVDHINFDTLDNTKINLRISTYGENNQNKNGSYSNSATGCRGVFYSKRMDAYYAQVRIDGVIHHLGTFRTIEEADMVAKEFRAKHMPFSQDAMPQTEEVS